MRSLGLILFVTLIAVGCNADPRCRRETALLRAEILDLEDKLAFATAGSTYDGSIVSSSDEIIISDPIIDSNGSQIIYESGASHSSRPSIHSTAPLEVQHQIFPSQPTTIRTQPAKQLDDLQIDIETPRLPSEINSVLPDSDRSDGLNLPNLKIPTNDGSNNRRTKPPRRRRSPPEIEISLDDSPVEMNFEAAENPETFITEILVNRDASGGQDVDGKRGDEGLNLLVQPKTANGSVYLEAGELFVDLIDPTINQTIGHWQFMPAETELFFASDRKEGKGILLHLPWEQNLPSARTLVASVSFITSDGRRLNTSSRLQVDPPTDDYSVDDPRVTGWTERDTRWEIGTHNQSVTTEASRWTRSRRQQADRSRQFAQEDRSQDRNESRRDESLRTPRVNAVPASSTRPATQLPSWRPVR